MKSPFPGMDPYLESRWPEVHASLIVYSRNRINAQLPGDLQANIEESVGVYCDDADDRSIRADVHVSEDTTTEFDSQVKAHRNLAVAVAAKPTIVKRPPHPTRHVEIVQLGGRLVTAIEFISPWKKVGLTNREQYGRKQLDYLDAGVNLVEIDLVRQGSYVLAAPLAEIPEGQRKDYMTCVFRMTKPDRFEVFRAPLQSPLPNIPIPLRPGERDIVLELQSLIDDCYRDGRYHRINYKLAPKATFAEAETRWIDSHLREQGHR